MNQKDIEIVNRRFKTVFKEIEHLKSKNHKIEGWLFFKTHVHTADELLNSPHHKKIYAWTEKIGDDCDNWYKNNNFSEAGKNAYDDKKWEVESALQDVDHAIENREPLWWEEVKGAFQTFIVKVMANMPELVRTLLEKSAIALHLPFLTKLKKIFKLPHFGKK